MSWLYRWLGCVLLLSSIAAPLQAEDPHVQPGQALVTLRERTVFTLRGAAGVPQLLERARGASRALANAVTAAKTAPARWETRGSQAVVFVGDIPIISLSPEDAVAADSTLEVLAARVTAQVQNAVSHERTRSSWAKSVFSTSLVVFFGLITLYLMGRLRAVCGGARDFLLLHPRRVPALKLNKLEVMGPANVRNALLISISVGRWLGLLGLVYAWLVVSLSLFERTRPLVERLTFAVLEPLSGLVSRIALALPVMVVAGVALALVAVLLRVTDLLFDSVARGETHLTWVPPDVAHASSLLVRGGIIVIALLFAGPVLTGDQDGPLSRGSLLVLISIALSTTPLLCSVFAGIATVFSRALRTGDRVEYGGQLGRVSAVGLLWLELEDEGGARVRVPHLRSLWFPTRVYAREVP